MTTTTKTFSVAELTNIRRFLASTQDDLERHRNVPDREDNRHALKAVLPNDWNRIAVAHWLLGQADQARAAAAEVVATTLDFFHGEWRDSTTWGEQGRDRAYWRRNMEWRDHLVHALAWAFWLQDSEAVDHLAAYPNEECPADSEPDRKALYLAICAAMLGHEDEPVSAWVDGACESRRTGIRRLGEALKAIRAGDGARAAQLLREHTVAHAAKNRRIVNFGTVLDYDGAVLLSVARSRGVAVAVDGMETSYLPVT